MRTVTLNSCEAYRCAHGLEVLLYKTFSKAPNKYKKLFSDIIVDAGNCCDAVTDAFYIPSDQEEGKLYALRCAYSAMKKIERRLDIAVNHEVNAISNETRARYDMVIDKLDINLKRWSNSLSKKCGGEAIEQEIRESQIPAVTPVGETNYYEDTLQGQIAKS